MSEDNVVIFTYEQFREMQAELAKVKQERDEAQQLRKLADQLACEQARQCGFAKNREKALQSTIAASYKWDDPCWASETMTMINRMTPDITGKGFDPDWFILRQRFEEVQARLNALAAMGEGKKTYRVDGVGIGSFHSASKDEAENHYALYPQPGDCLIEVTTYTTARILAERPTEEGKE